MWKWYGDEGGVGYTFETLESRGADTKPPTLGNLVFPSVINVTRGDATVSFGATAFDKGTGVSRVSIILDHSFYNADIGSSVSAIDLFDSLDPFGRDHFSARNITFGEETGTSTYHITGAYVTDKAQNQTYYSEAQLNGAGIETTFKIIDKSSFIQNASIVEVSSGLHDFHFVGSHISNFLQIHLV